jgi:hypothetical protein
MIGREVRSARNQALFRAVSEKTIQGSSRFGAGAGAVIDR